MSTWTIDLMKSDDIHQVLALENKLFSTPWSRISYENEIIRKDAHSFVVRSAKNNNKIPIIAYITFRFYEDEMHLFKIAVDRKWQNKGIASWLLTRCFHIAAEKGAITAYLEVRASNVSAITLYENLGFKIVGKRLNYYADTKENALIMLTHIKQETIS